MIKVTTCGYNSHHPKPCDIEHPAGLRDYLFLLVKTDAWFFARGKRIFTQPNMVILFDKGTYIRYGRNSPDYNDDWIHFQIDEAESPFFFDSFPIPLNQPLYPSDFHRLSGYAQMLTTEFRIPSNQSAQTQDSLMRALLYSLIGELSKPADGIFAHKHYLELSRLRTQLYNTPSDPWSAKQMADSLDLSLSYFQHLYKKFFHCACQQDIISARLEQAKFYLSTSNMNIRSLADFCGYGNELHFMRQFKTVVGMTPSEFRRKQRIFL